MATITESFNKADSDTLGPDLTWTELAGDIDVVSNQAQSTTLGSYVIARADTDLGSADHYAQAVIGASEETAAAGPSVIVRKDSTATLTHYVFYFNFSGDNIIIYKNIAGSLTSLQTTSSVTLTAGTTYLAKGEISGNSLKAYVDGVQKNTTLTDSSIATGQYAGIYGYKNSPGYVFWDSFEAGDLAGAAGHPTQRRHGVARYARPVAVGSSGVRVA